MAASTPRKTAPKKAPARRTPQERRTDNLLRFDEYRERAAKLKGGASGASLAPYVVSAAELNDGIDADVVLVAPAKLADRIALDRAIRANDIVAMIVILGGEVALKRIVNAFDALAEDTGEDASRLFAAFGYSVVNHLNGAGASETPGGTDAS